MLLEDERTAVGDGPDDGLEDWTVERSTETWPASPRSLAGAREPAQPGQTLARRYRLIEPIAAGAFGTVFAAVDRRLQKSVAVKVLTPRAAAVPAHRARFCREAIVVNRLHHDGIVEITDLDHDRERGLCFLVMELLDGTCLADHLAERGALPVRTALDIAAQAALALEHAHERGIVHRDLKPANLFLASGAGGEPRVKILDFGAAKIVGGGPLTAVTRCGEMVGTPMYMPPEQAQALPIDGRADVYALGVVLYEMLVGRPPFVADSRRALEIAHAADLPPPPSSLRPGLSPRVDALVARALEKCALDRYDSMAALHEALVRERDAAPEPPPAPVAAPTVDLEVAAPAAPATVPAMMVALAAAVAVAVVAVCGAFAIWVAG